MKERTLVIIMSIMAIASGSIGIYLVKYDKPIHTQVYHKWITLSAFHYYKYRQAEDSASSHFYDK